MNIFVFKYIYKLNSNDQTLCISLEGKKLTIKRSHSQPIS